MNPNLFVLRAIFGARWLFQDKCWKHLSFQIHACVVRCFSSVIFLRRTWNGFCWWRIYFPPHDELKKIVIDVQQMLRFVT